MRFFFYGSLLDRDVTALVLGRRLPPGAFVPAVALGQARRRAKGVTYPIMVREPRGRIEGAVLGGLSARDVARLTAYEGPRYRTVPLKVRMAGRLVTVSVFEPRERSFEPLPGSSWDLADWQRRYKRAFVARIARAFSAQPAYSRR